MFPGSKLLRLSLALLCAAPAQGQEFYAGTLYEVSEGFFVPESTGSDTTGLVGLAGIKVPVSDTFFIAGEAEVMFSGDSDDEGRETPFADGQRRYRAIVGANLPNFSVYVGTATSDTTGWDDDETGGQTLNIGIDVSLNDLVSIRLESVQDNFDIGDLSTLFDNDVLRIGTLINF